MKWIAPFMSLYAGVMATTETKPFELVVGLKQHNLEELERQFWEVSDPASNQYLKFKTREEIANLIGATQQEIKHVDSWLRELGASSVKTSALRDTLIASFPAGSRARSLSIDDSSNTDKNKRWIPSFQDLKEHVDFVLRRDDIVPTFKTAPKPELRDVTNGEGNVKNQKNAYGIPLDLKASHPNTTQMVWGPGTFGFNSYDLETFQTYYVNDLNTKKVTCNGKTDCDNNGDNFGEGSLDTEYISAMGLNVRTLVSNTNTSKATEEGEGFGQALLDFVNDLAAAKEVPHVLSMSLGSLSASSCDLLCTEAEKEGHSLESCRAYLQNQRQVCMFISEEQTQRINTGFQSLGLRGVSIFAASGDGGSHYSFGPFSSGALASVLNKISCEYQMPVFPASSPYVTSVGGTAWNGDSSKPVAWDGSGGGFSWSFPMPQHQKKTVNNYLSNTKGLPPSSSFNASGAAYPDIAALADVCIPLCVYGGCSDSGGTSAACPEFAGLFSMLIDHRLNNGLQGLGFVSPRIYQVGEQYPGEAFQDITSGNTKTTCDNGFPATPGWDPATGFGRPVWDGLLKYFGSDSAVEQLRVQQLVEASTA